MSKATIPPIIGRDAFIVSSCCAAGILDSGFTVGAVEGRTEGFAVGFTAGFAVGFTVGFAVGFTAGFAVGFTVVLVAAP